MADKCVSAVFKEQEQVDRVVRQLIDRGISKDNISVVGKNFKSETRIRGFLTRKKVILEGLKEGAIFGSLFGSFLGLLTEVGVLLVPFVGAVVAAGPLGAALLGAASGAIAGSLGAGLASALISLGMPKEKATIYETRLEAGEFLLVVEVSAELAEEIAQLLESGGGEEIATSDMKIPRQPSEELKGKEDLSPELKADLSDSAQDSFVEEYNKSLANFGDESKAATHAWNQVEQKYERDEQGVLSKAR